MLRFKNLYQLTIILILFCTLFLNLTATLSPKLFLTSPEKILPSSENIILGYHLSKISPEEGLQKVISLGTPKNASSIEEITKTIFYSFYHTEKYTFRTIFDGWILWLIEKYLKFVNGENNFIPLGDPWLVWRKGGGWCGQATEIFLWQMERLGIKARMIFSKDHVIAEVLDPETNKWLVADTDYGVLWPMSFEELQVVKDIEPLVKKLIDIGYPEESAKGLINLYQNKSLKWQIDPFDYKSLQELEHNMNILGWLISLLLGIILALRFICTSPPQVVPKGNRWKEAARYWVI